ncbi:sigma-70 family RNA polymerase sigma factor [Patescibacteria group bacterium]|nr:sigma-70 family RNA polymerase sigma factor [Patescibacteria group bacterium]
MTIEEKEIIELAKEDPTKFGILYEKYYDAIYRFVLRRVSVREDAEEIVSQTFFAALHNIKKFNWMGFSFSAWLYKIAYNNVISFYRKNKDRKHVSIDEMFSLSDEKADVMVGYEKTEACDFVKDLFKDLSEEDREILRLKYFEDMSNIDIANILNITPNALGVKLYRVLKKSKGIMQNY